MSALLRTGAEPPAYTVRTLLKQAFWRVIALPTPSAPYFPFSFSLFHLFVISMSERLCIRTPCLRVSVLILSDARRD